MDTELNTEKMPGFIFFKVRKGEDRLEKISGEGNPSGEGQAYGIQLLEGKWRSSEIGKLGI